MYVNSLACVTVKGDESETIGIHSGVSPGCVISPCLFKMIDGLMKEVKMGMG